MMRYFFFSLLLAVTTLVVGQDITAYHDVQSSSEPNTYNITTTVEGLEGADIGRLTYKIDNKHTFIPSKTGTFFSNRGEDGLVKFYLMAIPSTGVIKVSFGITINGSGEIIFPVELQYSKNEEKKLINLSKISINNGVLANNDNNEVEEESINTLAKEEEIKNKAEAEEQKIEIKNEDKEEIAESVKVEEGTKALEENQMLAKKEELTEKEDEDKEEIAESVKVEEGTKSPEENQILVKQQEVEIEEKDVKEEAMESVELEEESKVQQAELASIEEEKTKQEEPQKLTEDKEDENVTVKVVSTKKYTVQILSLAEFSQARLDTYCKKHNLPQSKIIKRKVGELTKISVGEGSKEEALQIQEELKNQYNITESFVTALP